MSADRHALMAALDYAAKLEQENSSLREELSRQQTLEGGKPRPHPLPHFAKRILEEEAMAKEQMKEPATPITRGVDLGDSSKTVFTSKLPVDGEKDASWMADLQKHAAERGICKDFDGQKSTFKPTGDTAFAPAAKEPIPVRHGIHAIEPFMAWVDGKLRKVELLAEHGGMIKVETIDDPSRQGIFAIKPNEIHDNDFQRVCDYMNRSGRTVSER